MKRALITIAIILFGSVAGLCQEDSAAAVSQDMQDLAAAERAFSATAVKEGFRDSFIKFFADDGIGFGPHPERTKEVLQKRPPQTGSRTLVFSWQPMFGDTSAAGDLGYTTGPVLFIDLSPNPKPPNHGIYFSVWQKQPDKTWKVVVDMGVDTPEAVAPIDTGFRQAARPKRGAWIEPPRMDADDFRSLDKRFSDSIKKTNTVSSYYDRLDDEFRIHRKGMMPILKKDSEKFRAAMHSYPEFKFLGGKISASQDFAFTYGHYRATAGKADSEEGYYVHAWRRDTSGKWRLVADVENPLPKKGN